MAQPAQAVPVWLSLAQGGPKHSSSPLVSDRAHICGSAWLRLGQHPGPGKAHVWLSLAHAGPQHGSTCLRQGPYAVQLGKGWDSILAQAGPMCGSAWLMLGPSMALVHLSQAEPMCSSYGSCWAQAWLHLSQAGPICGSAWLRLGQCVAQLG